MAKKVTKKKTTTKKKATTKKRTTAKKTAKTVAAATVTPTVTPIVTPIVTDAQIRIRAFEIYCAGQNRSNPDADWYQAELELRAGIAS